jgi:anti-sigma factor RsiW
MSGDACAEMRLLVQADLDGELSPAEAARVAAHLDRCAACAAVQAELLGLSTKLAQDAPRHRAPAHLRQQMEARFGAALAPPKPRQRPASWWPVSWRPALNLGGLALAASLALVIVWPQPDGLPDAVVSGHIRALQPGHLMDVVSTDQHTVKPWFDGRLDYAPPVRDLAAQGFPLQGGRLDVLEGRPVAALVYGRRQHAIDLYVVPGSNRPDRPGGTGAISGYNFIDWSEGGMRFWAVSDVSAPELAEFVRQWRRAP